MNVIIIHDSYSHPEENWYPWLKKELEKLGHDVFVPKFPTLENQTLEKARELAKNLGVDVILVKNAGHFNEKSGYTKFPLLLEKIKNIERN